LPIVAPSGARVMASEKQLAYWEKLSERMKGENNPAKRIEVRKKISEKLKGKKHLPQCGFQKGHKNYNLLKIGLIYKGEHRGVNTEFKKGQIAPMRGKKRLDWTGDKNNKWKGDEVGYYALHSWVERNLGKSDTCEHCGKSGLKGRQIHWANIDHKYKRNLTDWMRLCMQCHCKYDVKNNR
jgi:hypothetical protein